MSLLDVDRICVVICRTRHKMMQAEAKEAARQGAGLLELRLDFLKKAPDFKRLLEDKPCPLVATVRRPPDGGKWDGSEDARRMVLRQAIVAGFDWVDLETDAADAIPRFGAVKRIVSYHNLREMPADLEKIHQRMCAQDADVVKIAVKAQHPRDNVRVLSLIAGAPKPTVAFCVGDLGFPSRILQAKYGAPFTYAAFNPERIAALGIPSLYDLLHHYNYRSIDTRTRVFGVVGDPVGHSLSPLIHNAAFAALKANAVYLPIRVPRDALPAALEALGDVPVDGYSVTIPHKEAAATLATARDEAVEQCKAANTLLRRGDGWSAYNTDHAGLLQTLKDVLPTFAQVKAEPSAPVPSKTGILMTPPPPTAFTALTDRVVLVLGAGGVARAVTHALRQEGALVSISNRSPDRAQALASEVGCRHVDWNARHSVVCDIVVNCTAVGMHPNVDETPLHHSFLKPGLVVMDTVYTPEQTLLVKEARERGCHVITGVELFIRQAGLQFELFLGQKPPLGLFRQVVRKALSPVKLDDEEGPS